MRHVRIALVVASAFLFAAAGARAQQAMPADYRQVLTMLNRTGDYADGVLRINVPRNDLRITVAGVSTPTPFGFGGWIAMTKGDGGREVAMGDLVLLEDEVNPVMSALLDQGLDVTALHNHFFWDEPRVYFMHVHGTGTAAELAAKFAPALSFIGWSSAPPPAAADVMDTDRIAQIVGHTGAQNGAVYKITVGRDDIDLREMGAVINSRMGLNTWASFLGTDADAVIAGDVAMLAGEVTPVLRALRSRGIDVVAIHHHMTGVEPMVVFLHYWGRGPAADLAAAFRAALDELGQHGQSASARPR